jgi:hypothetical protein
MHMKRDIVFCRSDAHDGAVLYKGEVCEGQQRIPLSQGRVWQEIVFGGEETCLYVKVALGPNV